MPFEKIIENGTVYLEPEDPQFTLVWLHGLGDSGSNFANYFLEREKELSGRVRVVLPTARQGHCDLAGKEVNSWFNIHSLTKLDLSKFISEEEARASQERVACFLKEAVESHGGDASRVFLGGFSQGAALALLCGLEFSEKLGGVVAMSGFFIPFIRHRWRDLRLVIFHGDSDRVIPWFVAELSYGLMQGRDIPADITLLPDLQHQICVEEEEKLLELFKLK